MQMHQSDAGDCVAKSFSHINESTEQELRRALSELRASERSLAEAQEIAGLGSWDLDARNGKASWSRHMYRIFDANPEDPAVRTVEYFAERLVHPEDRERVIAALTQALEQGEAYEIEYRIRHRDGSIHEVLARGDVVERDEDGAPLRMLGTIQDVTERRREERRRERLNESLAESNSELRRLNKQLQLASLDQRESDSRYRSMVESCPDGIALLVGSTIVFANEAMIRLLKYENRADVVGRSGFSLIPETEYWQLQGALDLEEAPGYVSPLLSSQVICADGSVADIELKYSLVLWHGDRAMQIFVRDVTDRGKLEQQIRQMQKLDAIGTLAGGIAHDFNNILSGILGYADLARLDLPEESPSRASLDEVTRAGLRAKELVKQILTFSRQTPRSREPLEVSSVVLEALKLLRPSLPTTIDIRHELTANVGYVLADPTELHQVLLNLCTNAGQAMAGGGLLELNLRTIEVDEDFAKLHKPLEPGQHVLLSIRDTGAGMAPEVLERIFEPFYTTRESGTGLGLAVVYGIVDDMRGCLTVYSELGRGTVFNIYLPQLEGGQHGSTASAEEMLCTGSGQHVLLVDDELQLMRLSERILQRLGYQVTACNSGVEALAAFLHDPAEYDLLFTDQTMPGLTGLQLARQVLEVRPELPVILATGFASANLESEARELGIRQLAAKPLMAGGIAAAVKNALKQELLGRANS